MDTIPINYLLDEMKAWNRDTPMTIGIFTEILVLARRQYQEDQKFLEVVETNKSFHIKTKS